MPERLTLEVAEAAVALLNAYGDDGFSARMYSGRGMYGSEVPAITGPQGQLGRISGAIIRVHFDAKAAEFYKDEDDDYLPLSYCQEWIDEGREMVPERYDSMGRGTVYY